MVVEPTPRGQKIGWVTGAISCGYVACNRGFFSSGVNNVFAAADAPDPTSDVREPYISELSYVQESRYIHI